MMEPIDPSSLPGMPAPFWFIQFFKVLGFALHLVPMNLWYAGLVLAMLLAWKGGAHGRRFAARLMVQMPVLVALGINFGIVPLLFLQVAYPWAFYPATILMAWFWLAIVVLLVPAYYGVYAYAFGLGKAEMPRWRLAAGWVAAGLFLVIGFLFANGLSLMVNVADWQRLWLWQSIGGAPLGIALNVADPLLWPRWLLVFGLALGTTGAWTAIDTAWLAQSESPEYRRWAQQLAWWLGLAGAVWFAVAGSWYTLGAWPQELRAAMFSGLLLVLTLATAVSPGATAVVLWLARGRAPDRGLALAAGGAQFMALALNATSRQMVQNLQLAPLLKPWAQPVDVQWSPLVVFLLIFVAGAGVVVWMIGQIWNVSTETS